MDTPTVTTGDFYTSHDRFPVSVDCIIFSLHDGELSVLLAPRKFEPELGVPSLMGGFVNTYETIDEAASRVLSELTGLDGVYMEQVGAFGSLDRDPGARVISIAYFALIKSDGTIDSRISCHNAEWVSIEKLPPLHFDHPLMIEKALSHLRAKLTAKPIVFNLLPEYFTLASLQDLYEKILGEPVDKRNFRRRILENTCVEPTDRIDRLSSRRGAVLYHFNHETYCRTKKFKI